MNIDERLEKLAERHEALTQTVELIAALHRDNEKRYDEIARKTDKRFEQVARNFEIVLDSIKRLENIAAGHEQRLDDIQGQ
jgi:predicted transcriptional regulator